MNEDTLIGDTPLSEIVDESSDDKKSVILDATVLSTIMSCPRLADFKFNHHLQSINGKSNSLECGSIAHTFLEYFYRNRIEGVKYDEAKQFGMAAAEMYIHGCPSCVNFEPSIEFPKPICGHKANEFPGVFNTPKDSDTGSYKIGWQHVLDTMDEYCQFYINDHWVPLEVEVVKAETLYEDDDVRILWKAKLDLVCDTNQGIFPIDHKTMKQRRDTVSLNNQFIGQCLLSGTRQVFINKVGFQKTLKPHERFTRPPVSYSAARLLEWQSETLPYYAKLLTMYSETGHFPPNYTHCESKYGNCQFISVCESDPNMREDEIKRLFVVGPEWNPTIDED